MKTINDIVAELRKHSDETNPPQIIFNENGEIDMTLLADCIEAANKREIEDAIAATVKAAAKSASEVYEPHIQSTQVGNAAKMREALECIDSIAKYLEAGTIRDILHAYRNIQDRVRIALSAPPRNCDRFATFEDAGNAWEKEALHIPLIKWLFAKAEGEAK